jgi:hypothetical protein
MRLAFVLTPKPMALSGSRVAASFARMFPGERPTLGKDDDGVTASLTIGGDDIILGAMPVPVPNGEAESAAQFSLGAFSKAPPLAPHGAHITVVQRDTRPARESLTRFTRALAAVIEATDAVGVYWGEAGATHTAQFFLDVVRAEDGFLMLWTGVSTARESADRVSLLSLGMKQLGQPDLMVSAPAASAGQTFPILLDMLSYAIDGGAPPADRETIGRTAQEKWTVRHGPNPIDPARSIWRIDLPDDFR